MKPNIGFLLGLTIMFTSGPTHAEDTDRRFVGTILFPNPKGGAFAYSATWKRVPSAEEVRAALSNTVKVEGRTEWKCHVNISGSLRDCVMETAWPSDVRYEKAGRALLGKFQLAEETAADAQTNDATVVFPISFFGAGLNAADMSSCPPPFCIPVPPPPPPPPSSP